MRSVTSDGSNARNVGELGYVFSMQPVTSDGSKACRKEDFGPLFSQRRVMIEKVKGTENPADLVTKHFDGPAMDEMLKRIGSQAREGRAAIAPDVVGDNGGNGKSQANMFEGAAKGRLSVSWANDIEAEEEQPQ